nr:immunoglobulin heavy chain junction region [Mus musculus]NSM09152.1 immunoglobulin heavy chain junction region [Mus musculus]
CARDGSSYSYFDVW